MPSAEPLVLRRLPPEPPHRLRRFLGLLSAASVGAGAVHTYQSDPSLFGFASDGRPASVAAASLGGPLPPIPARPTNPQTHAAPTGPVVVGPGKVEPVHGLLQLALDTPGVLARVTVEEGQTVAAGRLLAELANGELAARVRSAGHELAAARHRLALLVAGARREEVDEARHQFEEARLAADRAAELVRERESLFARRAASPEEVADHRCRALESARRRDAAGCRLAKLKAGSRPEEIAAGEAAVALAESRVAELQAALDRTRLVAPRAGQVLRLLRREGESVMGLEASPILTMADLSALQVRAELDETQTDAVKVGDPAVVRTRGSAGRTYSGRVRRIGGVMGRKQIVSDDPRERVDSRVLEIVVSLDACDGLTVGRRVDVTIHSPSPKP